MPRTFDAYQFYYERPFGRFFLGVLLIEAGNGAFADLSLRHDLDRLLEFDSDADITFLRALEADIRKMLQSQQREYIDSEIPTSRRDWIIARIKNDFSNTITVNDPVQIYCDSPAEELHKLLQLYAGPRQRS